MQIERRSVFAVLAALFGVQRAAKAHERHTVTIMEMDCLPKDKLPESVFSSCRSNGKTHEESIYGPNKCPVCGAMAEPYHRKTESEFYGSGACLGIGDGGGNTYAVCRQPSDTKRVGPMERITRCKRCNTAFWQDAEGEPK